MSVRTQCSRHRLVTKSSKESMSGNVRPRVPFSSVTVGRSRAMSSDMLDGNAEAFEGRWRRRKWWFWTRYSAIECLPAHMPVDELGDSRLLNWDKGTSTTSTDTDQHFETKRGSLASIKAVPGLFHIGVPCMQAQHSKVSRSFLERRERGKVIPP